MSENSQDPAPAPPQAGGPARLDPRLPASRGGQAQAGGWRRYIGQGWLVLALALCFGGMLAGVEGGLKDRIAENKRNETLRAIPRAVKGAASGRKDQVGGITVYRAFDGAGKQIGWMLPAAGQGFADKIELLIGLDMPVQRVTGLYVLDQKETPGLGDNIRGDKFRDPFRGKNAREALSVAKADPSGNQISAVTGATVSSDSVCAIANAAIRAFRKALAAGEKP